MSTWVYTKVGQSQEQWIFTVINYDLNFRDKNADGNITQFNITITNSEVVTCFGVKFLAHVHLEEIFLILKTSRGFVSYLFTLVIKNDRTWYCIHWRLQTLFFTWVNYLLKLKLKFHSYHKRWLFLIQILLHYSHYGSKCYKASVMFVT